jgi:hypothetical protein
MKIEESMEKKKITWGVASQLENISQYMNVIVSYLNFNKPKFDEQFGERSEEVMTVLNEVKEWLNKESAIVHKEIMSVFEKRG